MSKFLEGRVLEFLNDDLYDELPQKMKETKLEYHRRFDLVRRKMKRVETLKQKLVEEKDNLKSLKGKLVRMKPKVDTLLKNFKISISMSSYKKKYVKTDGYGYSPPLHEREGWIGLRKDGKTEINMENYLCYIERGSEKKRKKSIHLGTEDVLKKYLIKKYINQPGIIKEVEKDVIGYVMGVVYGDELYDRTIKLILDNPRKYDNLSLNKDWIFI